jgi:hypothetical protein
METGESLLTDVSFLGTGTASLVGNSARTDFAA